MYLNVSDFYNVISETRENSIVEFHGLVSNLPAICSGTWALEEKEDLNGNRKIAYKLFATFGEEVVCKTIKRQPVIEKMFAIREDIVLEVVTGRFRLQ